MAVVDVKYVGEWSFVTTNCSEMASSGCNFSARLLTRVDHAVKSLGPVDFYDFETSSVARVFLLRF